MPKHGRKYEEAAAKVDRSKLYNREDAIKLIKETAVTNFDPTVEVHMRLGVDPRHADQQVRDVVVLPNGLGKSVRVLVFAEGEDANVAREAGADVIADDEVIKRIQEGWTEFDVAIAVPSMMGKVGRLGRVLGPRGLMPNPRAGTVAPAADLPRLPIGKASFTQEQLVENLTAFIGAVKRARPSAAKGTYIQKITVANTMGPGIKLDPVEAAL